MTVHVTTSHTIECDRCGVMTATSCAEALPAGWRVVHFVAHRRYSAAAPEDDMDLCPKCVEGVRR